MHAIRASTLIPILTFLMAVGGCATSGVNQGDFNVVSIEEEWQLGRQLETDLAGQLDLVADPIVLRYVNEVGNRIVRQTEMSGLPWEFHVVENEEINAFNIPGGHVYIHTGLIEAADTSSELAGVMAHEIGHGVARHATEQLTRVYGLNIVASLLLGSDPQAYQQILAEILGTGAIASFSRDAEREADQLAIGYLYEARYDPRGFVTFLETIMSESQRRSDPVSRFFATHPLTQERINYTRTLVDQLPPQNDFVNDDTAFQEARRRLR